MRVPEVDKYARFFQAVGIFIAGGIVGAAVFMSIHQHLFNLLLEQNYALKDKVAQLEEENRRATKQREIQGAIAKINVRVVAEDGKAALDSITQKELETKIRNDLKFLIGKKSADIQDDLDVYTKLLASKTFFGVQGKDYRVDVHALFLSGNQLTYYVKAKDSTKTPTLSGIDD
ncbi:hypothetical protein ACFFK0_16915 [Paenibacillus chartarius]|uniref:Sporulation membrane protein YtrI C-terminal domain-containing protein n=1 Tax=Paenibacillus chartarius TaxID=747481 RepID=A0ABV6DNA1_9BACL